MQILEVVFPTFPSLAFSTVLASSLALLAPSPPSIAQVVHGIPLFVPCSIAYELLQPPFILPTQLTTVPFVYSDFHLPLFPVLPLFHGQQLIGRIHPQ